MEEQNPNLIPQPLPNATTSLVLGILSIVFCCSLVNLVLGIIGLTMGNRAIALYNASPGVYTSSSYQNASAGRICSIIGVVLGGLALIYVIFYLVVFGTVGLWGVQSIIDSMGSGTFSY